MEVVDDFKEGSPDPRQTTQTSRADKITIGSGCQRTGDKEKKVPLTPQQIREKVLFNPDTMAKVFGYLALEDQNRFRLVCMQWSAVAHQYWESIIYDCEKELMEKQFPRLIKDLKERPLLKHIKCTIFSTKCHNLIIDTVIENIEDLHQIEMFIPTLNQIKSMASKFENLNSIALDCRSERLLSALEHLSTCKNLKTLMFTMRHSFIEKVDRRKCPAICNSLAYGFPALTKLVLNKLDRYVSQQGLKFLLQKKSNNLVHLEVSFCEKVDTEFINSVNSCSLLQYLRLEVISPDSHIDLSNLSALKSLKLTFCETYTKDTVDNTFKAMGCTKTLEEVELKLEDDKYDINLIKLLIAKTPNLKLLTLKGVDENVVESDLAEINYLRDLEHLWIEPCNNMTNRSVSYISKCQKLKKLVLLSCPLKDFALVDLEKCSSLENLSLTGGKFSAERIWSLIVALKNLKLIYIKGHDLSYENETFIRHQCELYGRKVDVTFDKWI